MAKPKTTATEEAAIDQQPDSQTAPQEIAPETPAADAATTVSADHVAVVREALVLGPTNPPTSTHEVRRFRAVSPTVFRRRLVGIGEPLDLTETEHATFHGAGIVAEPWTP